jgi:4-hydroxybenzoate polyprenyltransferase
MAVASRLPLYASLLRLDKPVGVFLLLWPTLIALWIASDGTPTGLHVTVFTLGTLLMRSAGCAINDAADYRFDARVKRTAGRVVARGAVAPSEAIKVAMVLAAAAALLLPLLNVAAAVWAVAALAVAATYPLAKRVLPVPQLYLGVAFSFGIPMAFAAVQSTVTPTGWLLFVANLLWVVAYDTEYAMVDRDDDVALGIHSSAIFFGRADVAVVMACHGGYLSLMLLAGHAIHAGWVFYAAVALALVLALRQYHLIRGRTRDGCFRAFLDSHWIGLVILIGLIADYGMRQR